MVDTPALEALAGTNIDYEVTQTKPAGSIEEAARLRGVAVGSVLKTLVVRRGEDDHVFVVVSGDRVIDWPKLRSALGVRRLSLPDAAEAQRVTGYERGAITPFGSVTRLPVVVDAAIEYSDDVSIGGGAHGVSVRLDAAALVTTLAAVVEDVTRPAG